MQSEEKPTMGRCLYVLATKIQVRSLSNSSRHCDSVPMLVKFGNIMRATCPDRAEWYLPLKGSETMKHCHPFPKAIRSRAPGLSSQQELSSNTSEFKF